MAKKLSKGRYRMAEIHIKPTGRKGRYKRAVKLTIFLPEGLSKQLFEELKTAFKKSRTEK
jgi:hypothetical protein